MRYLFHGDRMHKSYQKMSPVAAQPFWKHISVQQRLRSKLHCKKQILQIGEGLKEQNKMWVCAKHKRKGNRQQARVSQCHVSLSFNESNPGNLMFIGRSGEQQDKL